MTIADLSVRTKPGTSVHLALWLCAFSITFIVAAFIQFVVLGMIFPDWSSGHGLLLATDSIGYHNMAVDLAERIAAEGWAVWELAPLGHFTVGLVAAHYALMLPEPWVVIPSAATATAFSVLVLFQICLHFIKDWRIAVLAVAPYMLFPSAAFWYAQLLKDTYFNLGILIFAYGYMILAARATWTAGWRRPALGLTCVLLGYVVMGMIRPYALTLMWLTAVLLSALTILVLILYARGTTLALARVAFGVGLHLIAVAGMHQGREELAKYELMPTSFTDELVNMKGRFLLTRKYWQKTPWLPQILDNRFATLAGVRHAYLFSGKDARSEIDREFDFQNSVELLSYLPRAAQIAFLAPFPNHWFGEGSTEATTMMRKITMAEMLLTYVFLLFAPYALWHWRQRGEIWVLSLFCAVILMIYSVSTPNLGTLYRVRYAYLMVFVAMGIMGMATLWRDWRARERLVHSRVAPSIEVRP